MTNVGAIGSAAAVSGGFDIAPWLGLAAGVLVALIAGGFAIYNRRRGNVETKAPSVAESWDRAEKSQQELDIERELRRWWQNTALTLRGLVRRILVLFGAGSIQLTPDEEEALTGSPPILKD